MPEGQKFDDLEDPDKHYSLLGCSKTSSDDKIDRAIKRLNKKLYRIITTSHPDKTTDTNKHKKYDQAYVKWKRAKRAKNVLATPDDNGCFLGQFNYNKRREEMCQKLGNVVNEIYNMSFESKAKQSKERNI